MNRVPHVIDREQADGATRYPVYCRMDQLDGNFHVLDSWGMVVLNSDVKAWEDDTYPLVARLTDVAIDWPYLAPRIDRCSPGLAHNFVLEHSREVRYWDAWDLLTQCWACKTLRLLSEVAKRRGDSERAARWKETCATLEANVHEKLTMEIDGKLVYAEMRLPDGGEGRIFDGLSWINLSPVMTEWEGADPKILRNTIETYREKARITWKNHSVVGDEWGPNGRVAPQVIGKGIGWDMVYAIQQNDYDYVIQWLDFIGDVNNDSLFGEAFNVADDEITLQDPGNGEQCSWWCWGMAKVRKAVGLSAAP